MSLPQVLGHDPGRLPAHRRWAARAAVLVARGLARQPPNRLLRLMDLARRGAAPAGREQAGAARRAVVLTSYLCASPEGCLPRSIAAALLCRLGGTWPTWCVGVRVLPPFGAHAWIEVDGRAVDEPFPAGYHRPLFTVPPS